MLLCLVVSGGEYSFGVCNFVVNFHPLCSKGEFT